MGFVIRLQTPGSVIGLRASVSVIELHASVQPTSHFLSRKDLSHRSVQQHTKPAYQASMSAVHQTLGRNGNQLICGKKGFLVDC